MSYEDLKKKIVISPRYIDVDKHFIAKEHLSMWDIRELARMIECIDNYTETTTINKRVADLLKRCEVTLIEDGIGWSL